MMRLDCLKIEPFDKDPSQRCCCITTRCNDDDLRANCYDIAHQCHSLCCIYIWKKHVKLKLLVIFLFIVKPKIALVVYRQCILVYNTDKYIPYNIRLYHYSFFWSKIGLNKADRSQQLADSYLLIADCWQQLAHRSLFTAARLNECKRKVSRQKTQVFIGSKTYCQYQISTIQRLGMYKVLIVTI